VLGTPRELDKLVAQHGVKAVVVTMPDLAGDRLARMAASCERLGIELMRVRMLLDQVDDASRTVAVRTPYVETSIAATFASASSPVLPLPPTLPAPSSLLAAVRVLEAEPCGGCGGRNVHRSKARGAYERFRKLHTPRRPYRCDDCGWRGWLMPLEQATPLIEGGTHPEMAI
jgi:hypothetical protein